MSESAEPQEVAVAAAGPRAPHWRRAMRLAGSLLVLAALLFLATQLIAARVPEQRAALQQLLRRETGLEIAFDELTVRWGWYGPEAVFHGVALGELGRAPLLRAPQLVVSLDLWRTLRSGHLEAGRIALLGPEFDIPGASSAARAQAGARLPADASAVALARRLLHGWRGGRIDIQSGQLHWFAAAAGERLTATIEHADLRRLGEQWSADARLTLPESLGARAHLALRLAGTEAGTPPGGTLDFQGERLSFGGWHALSGALGAYLPQAGEGNLTLHARFGGGQLQRLEGEVHAQALAWAAREGGEELQLPRVRGTWQLQRAAQHWQLTVPTLDLGDGAAVSAQAGLGVGKTRVRGSVQGLALARLTALAHWYAPQWPLAQLSLAGRVRAFDFDWDGARAAGERLQGRLEVTALSIGGTGAAVQVAGLNAHLQVSDAQLLATLEASAAQLLRAGSDAPLLEPLNVNAQLTLSTAGAGWRLNVPQFALGSGPMSLAAQGSLSAPAGGTRELDGTLRATDLDAALVSAVLGPDWLGPLGQLSAGRIASADLEAHAPLSADAATHASGPRTHGVLEVRDATLAGDEQWPEARNLSARLEWRGGGGRAQIQGGQVAGFEVESASASWQPAGAGMRVQARLRGRAEDALQWLRTHPTLASYVPPAPDFEVRGATLLELDVHPGTPTGHATRAARVSALLDGVQLHVLAGLAPVEGLRGTISVRDGRLLRSNLNGRWLGGPVSLALSTQGERGAARLTLAARGFADLSAALLPGSEAAARLSGSTDWSALLSVLAGADATPARFTLRADASLAGVASRLPEPFSKGAGFALPLHLEVTGPQPRPQVRFSLGERLAGTLALLRTADTWRIERGAFSLARESPPLPEAPVVRLEGHLLRLDLPAYLALWQQGGGSQMLPALEAHLSAQELLLGERSYRAATVSALASVRGGSLEVHASEFNGSLSWPGTADAAHPAQVRLDGLPLEQVAEATAAAGALSALLGPAVQFSVEELRTARGSLGRLSGLLLSHGQSLTLQDLSLHGAHEEAQGSGHCGEGRCLLRLHLDSNDAAATLVALGLRADLEAQRAQLAGELEWQPGAADPLATLGGHLHMQAEEGLARAGMPDRPFPLFLVPALIGALRPPGDEALQPRLHFQRLSADFQLQQGTASTQNLHFDGDAEILVRARIGLVAQDYEGQAFILRGEERLPSAVRRLAPTPKIAALWLSLREWFGGALSERSHVALRLRGSWQDPIVSAAE